MSTIQDQVVLALTLWRENRSGAYIGMQSVANVVANRIKKSGESAYIVCTSHAQFSSISMAGPESYLWPSETDPLWKDALAIAAQAIARVLPDITEGATLYYAPAGMPKDENGVPETPSWVSKVTQTVIIANQIFFK